MDIFWNDIFLWEERFTQRLVYASFVDYTPPYVHCLWVYRALSHASFAVSASPKMTSSATNHQHQHLGHTRASSASSFGSPSSIEQGSSSSSSLLSHDSSFASREALIEVRERERREGERKGGGRERERGREEGEREREREREHVIQPSFVLPLIDVYGLYCDNTNSRWCNTNWIHVQTNDAEIWFEIERNLPVSQQSFICECTVLHLSYIETQQSSHSYPLGILRHIIAAFSI